MDLLNIETFKGKTFTSIKGMEINNDEVYFHTDSETFKMFHCQDCCESVFLQDVTGDVNDLIDTPILEAYEETSRDKLSKHPEEFSPDDSFTWTFYRLSTIKGTVTLRWFGSSNGYYSESVEIIQVTE